MTELFVYGTLRVGHGNWSWMKDSIISTERDCVLAGARIYNVSDTPRPIFPVLCITNNPRDKVIGDIFHIDPDDPIIQKVYRMEFGAGYDLAIGEVEIPGIAMPRACEMFVYTRTPDWGHIKSGDWNVFASEDIMEEA